MTHLNEIYCDANASHPLLPLVSEKLSEAMNEQSWLLSNPSSIHQRGQKAKSLVYLAKKLLIEKIGRADAEEIIFNSGATESLNSVIQSFQDSGDCVFTTNLEHSAVIEAVEASKASVREIISVDSKTLWIDEEALFEKMDSLRSQQGQRRFLFVLQLGNNEIGSIYPLESFLDRLRSYAREHGIDDQTFVLIDCAQSLCKLDDAVLRKVLYHCDYAAFSAHKIGALSGCGALWLRSGVPYQNVFYGGAQEKGRRPGTSNIAGIYSFYIALKYWSANQDALMDRLTQLRDHLYAGLLKIPGMTFHAFSVEKKSSFLPNILNFKVKDCPDESLLLNLDLHNIFASNTSACHSGTLQASHVLKALNLSDEEARSSIRLSLSILNSFEEIDTVIQTLQESVQRILENRKNAEVLFPEIISQ